MQETKTMAKVSFFDKTMNKFFYMGKPRKHIPAAMMLFQMSIKNGFTVLEEWEPMYLEMKTIFDAPDKEKAIADYMKKLANNRCGQFLNLVD
jgi:hypothetical protein